MLSSPDEQSFIIYHNEDVFSPLHATTANNELAVSELLIEARCNLNVTNCYGRTTLLNIVQHGFTV
jgi:hypothetical protein